MLKAMRKHAKFFYVLFFIVILSFIFWGVGTVDKSTNNVPVAEIEKEKISVEEYWTAYDRAREFYRNIFKEKFNEEMEKQLNLKQKVLDSLVDERVLLIVARKAGLTVSDSELQEAVMNDPLFVREGRFNREVYLRVLQLNRLTPEFYESVKRRELLLAKMRRLIGEAAELTEADLKPAAVGDKSQEALRQAMLLELRDAAVKSFVDGAKKDLKIMINQKLVS